MLEGWLPIILTGIAAAVIAVLARFFDKATMYTITSLLSVICILLLLYSIFFVGGWKGMGIGFFAISIFAGNTLASVISLFIKKRKLRNDETIL